MDKEIRDFLSFIGLEEVSPEEFVKWSDEQFKKDEDERKKARKQIRKTHKLRGMR